MARGFDHLVIDAKDLDRLCDAYRSLGFTLTPQARHPFGTGNSLVQLDKCFLELLSVLAPADIPEPSPGHFSFGAFNRDFLRSEEGMSMLVLDSTDVRADQAAFVRGGVDTYAPFDFSRKAKQPDGTEATVGFSLAFATRKEMPLAAFFTCQQHAPQYFWKPEYQVHANTALTIADACLVADEPGSLDSFLTVVTGSKPSPSGFVTGRGTLRVVKPAIFEAEYGSPSPSLAHGPRLAGFTIAVQDLSFIEKLGLKAVGPRRVTEIAGVAVAFSTVKRLQAER